jgi:hypothetical protein
MRRKHTMSILRMDYAEWKIGYDAGLHHDNSKTAGASWAWLSGWIEGEAERMQRAYGKRIGEVHTHKA